MGKTVPPGQIEINDDLEQARPLTYSEFCEIKNGNRDPEQLDQAKVEFYQSIRELAKSIKKKRQHYPSTCRKKFRDEEEVLELVTGYRRYLACTYIGCPVRIEVRRMSDQEVLDMIYSENENREGLDPYDRAVLIAKQMGRWSDEDGFVCADHPEADSDADTISEFAERNGKNRGLIYQQLSPVRQNKSMRDEFGDEISESSFQLIEQIASNTSEQYTLGQALVKSDVKTHSKFQSIYKLNKQKDKDTVKAMCRSLIGFEEEDVKGSYVHPEDQTTSSYKSIEEKEQEIKDKNSSEAGQKVPDVTQNGHSDTEVTIENTNNAGKESNEDDSGGVGYDTHNGTSMLPNHDEQPASDDPLDVELPAGEKISKLVRETAEEQERDESEVVADIVRIHYRREGELSDIPELAQMS